MTPFNLKHYYQYFLKGHEGKLHFAAHSHHFWPDVSRDAHIQYWDDCARLSDSKWDHIFSEVIAKTRKHIADILNLKHPEQIVIAPNSHELSSRILSLFLGKDKISILTTTNEFHSWKRQLMRLAELPQTQVKYVDSSDVLNNREAFVQNVKKSLSSAPDICFLSQVFFDSGLALTDDDLLEIAEVCPKETVLVIDGYHGFGALPTDLSKLEGRIFYLSGGYKYAQSGEGVGFLVVPKGNWRPAYTGWFAEFANLTKPTHSQVGYASDGMAFMGATQDPSGCYRMNAVWDLFRELNLDMEHIHAHVKSLQKVFIENLPPSFCEKYKFQPLFHIDLKWHGHFLTFETERAEEVEKYLKSKLVLIDRRNNRLRFGFGLYQDSQDVLEMMKRIS